MEKRGQFYLITTIIILSLVAGFVVVSNYSKETTKADFSNIGKELQIESEKVLDYGTKNGLDPKTLLINFTKDFSNYSAADSLYFVFGNSSEIVFSGYKKLEDGTVYIDAGSGSQSLVLSKNVYNYITISGPAEDIKVTVDSIEHDFTLDSGENFYFVVSKEINGDRSVFTNE